MIIQRMPWAGVHIKQEEASLVIDPLFNVHPKYGSIHESVYPLSDFGAVDAVLVTHLHADHFDPVSIASFYGEEIPVYVPEEAVPAARESGLKNVIGVTVEAAFPIGSFTVTPTYSIDGNGDPQVAWVVEAGGKKIIHCGDTLWHGCWWKIAEKHGPFDAAFLPVNAAVIQFPNRINSGLPITLSPEQAVAAAKVLQAKRLVPIHFRMIHSPPFYQETSDIVARLEQSAEGIVPLRFLDSKDNLVI